MHSSSNNLQPMTSAPAKTLRGTVRVPGDKSISHRALMLASAALGTTSIHGLLEGEDVLATAKALRTCGVPITREADGTWIVSGRGIGGLHEPDDVLDMGNAGTAARLMMGLLAPYPFTSTFTGDASLRKRPMQRVIGPLSEIGASFWSRDGGRLPLTMRGTDTPTAISYTLPVASAQVKSAILLAALNTAGTTTVIEREATRDHSERMLRFFGVDVTRTPKHDGSVTITLRGQPQQTPQNRDLRVPSDPSSAAFPIVAALLVPDS
jgi:3-phosphoshikimate 1-carboxyvinyltransferase